MLSALRSMLTAVCLGLWAISLIAQPSCPTPESLFIQNLTAFTAEISWAPAPDAQGYEWQIGVSPFSPGGTSVLSGTSMDTTLVIAPLIPVTAYDFYVRTDCGNGSFSDWQQIGFTTQVNCDFANTLVCQTPQNVFATGAGLWKLNCYSPQYPTLGKERVFRFTAPVTREYTLQVLQTNGGYVDYFFKDASLGCGPAGWKCIDDFIQPGSATFGPLTAGKEYLILFDPETVSPVSQKFRITNCEPVNDEAAGAIELAMNVSCTGNIHSNEGGSYVFGEPNPDTAAIDGLVGRWLDAANQTVWFKFVAPPSGTVTISTEGYPQGSNYDTQLALYEATDSTDYSTFQYIESDEDNGSISFGYNAIIYYTGLHPGQTYYIQTDGFGVSGQGTFCIEVLEGVARTLLSDCDGYEYTVENVDGTTPEGDRWYGIYTTPDILDLGLVVAAIKPGPQNLGTVSCRLSVTDTIPVSTNGIRYMPAYYHFSAENPPAEPVQLRLLFFNDELDSLKYAVGDLTKTAEDLNVTNYFGINEDCIQTNNSTPDNGTAAVISDVDVLHFPVIGSFFLEFSTATLGEFGAHFGLIPLPIELLSFSGKPDGAVNRLEWTTASEHNVQWHRIERSSDGLHWTEIGKLPGQTLSTTERHYHLDDQEPLNIAYYRLRTTDFDGTDQVSKVIFIARQEKTEGILATFPSPATGLIDVRYFSGTEGGITILLTDSNGRLVLARNLVVQEGINEIQLDLGNLPAGVYALRAVNGSSSSSAFRIIKQ